MVRILLTLTLLGLFGPVTAQPITDEDAEVFYEIVALGPISAVAASLAETPALATARDAGGFEPIHMLDYAGFAEKLALLLANGADINARNDDGIGLIHILIAPEFLPIILAAGADLNLRDAKGRTPLMLFAQEQDGDDMLRALLQAGADATLRDSAGNGVLFYGAGGDPALIQLLAKAGAPVN